jgi:hypothetical protein
MVHPDRSTHISPDKDPETSLFIFPPPSTISISDSDLALLGIALAPAVLLTVWVPSSADKLAAVVAGVGPGAAVALGVPKGALDVADIFLGGYFGRDGVGGSEEEKDCGTGS